MLGYTRLRTSPISNAAPAGNGFAAVASKPVGALSAHWPCAFAVEQFHLISSHKQTCA